MSAKLVAATIGSNAASIFRRWARANNLAAEADCLLAVLQVDTAKTDLLAVVAKRLILASEQLSQWQAEGAELFGLGALSTALAADPDVLNRLSPGWHDPPFGSILPRFSNQADSHHLYILWCVRKPVRPSARPWFDTLRLWLLLASLDRASQLSAVVHNRRIQIVAKRLRLASEETSVTTSLDFVEKLNGPGGWFRLQHHLGSLPQALTDADRSESSLLFRDALRRIANSDFETDDESVLGSWDGGSLVVRRDIPDLPSLVRLDSDDEVTHPAQSVILSVDAEEEDEQTVDLVEVEPTDAPAAQELRGRYIQLLSGAEARYLAWDWYGLTPPEATALGAHVELSLTNPGSNGEDLLAALVWIALRTGRSLSLTERLRLCAARSGAPDDGEWAVDIAAGLVFRRPPRRVGHWTPPTSEALACLRTAGERLDLTIPAHVQSRLQAACACADAPSHLVDLWRTASAESLRTAFRAWTDPVPALRRITQGMLSTCRGRDVFSTTGDHVLARLLASQPSAGLPASTAYVAYFNEQVPGHATLPPDQSELNVAGSRLDPLDDHLQSGFARLRQHIAELAASGTPLEHHNAVTRYWDSVLLAATGIRPYAERWTDAGTVDEASEFVVVDDKPSISGARTRLVPLPTGLWERFRRSYLEKHLSTVVRWLADMGVDNAADLLSPQKDGCRPLLFLLRVRDGSLVQLPVAAGTAEPELLPEAPLPRRTYRHRLRTRLHRAGADPEVLDSIFGHLDGATITHGDHSIRTWLKDACELRPFLNQAFAELKFEEPPAFDGGRSPGTTEVTGVRLLATHWPAANADSSGVRWLTQLKAARSAVRLLSDRLLGPADVPAPERLSLKEIARRLGKTTDPAKLDALGHQMMRAPQGAPSTLGPLRYGFFIRLIEMSWQLHGLRPPIHRRMLTRECDDSPFRRSAVGALARRAALIARFQAAMSTQQPSGINLRLSLWVAMIDLALSSRCVDAALLDVLVQRRAYRICRFRDDHFLEWHPSEVALAMHTPVQRLRISQLAAFALLRWASSKSMLVTPDSPVPSQLEDWAGRLDLPASTPRTFAEVIEALAELVGQCNAIELPGILGAHLAGRLRSAAMPWADWLAVRDGKRRDTRGFTLAKQDEELPLYMLSQAPVEGQTTNAQRVRASGRQRPCLTLDAQHYAKLHCGKVRELMEHDELGPATSLTPGSPIAETSYRRNISKRIDLLADQAAPDVSSALVALTRWCSSLLVKQKGRKLLRLSTVRRYFAALSPRFEAIGAQVDLLGMDKEEIEDFYRDVIELRVGSRRDYPFARIKEFHRFGIETLGLPSIDWSEIEAHEEPQLCSPGFVDEATFRRLIIVLARDPELDSGNRLAIQALAILGYRAGLRSKEAKGLLAEDIYLDDAPPWLAVEKNRLRDLKSLSARRTVPMPHLRPLELRVLRRLLTRATLIARGGSPIQALFTDPLQQGRMLDLAEIGRKLNECIKTVSGQTELTMHHLRHSFANRLGCDLEPALPQALVPARPRGNASDVRQMFALPTDARRSTRRSVWALCRVLGHAHPRTTFKSYIHLLGDLAERDAFTPVIHSWPTSNRVAPVDLDVLPLVDFSIRIGRAPKEQLQAVHALALLSDICDGVSVDVLTGRYPIGFGEAVRLIEVVSAVEARLKAAGAKLHLGRKRPVARSGVMRHVLESRLPALRKALLPFFTTPVREQVGAIGIDADEFVSMFGSRRTINMWRRRQFALVDLIIRTLDLPDECLKLSVPADLSPTIKRLAIDQAWLRRTLGESLRANDPNRPWNGSTKQFDTVIYMSESIRNRIVLCVTDSFLQTRWELIGILLSIAPLLCFNTSPD